MTTDVAAHPVTIATPAKPTPYVRFKIPLATLKDLIEVCTCLVDAAKITFAKDGAKLQFVDPAHVAMITADLPRTAFTEYNTHNTGEIALDIDSLKDWVKLLKDDPSFHYDADSNRIIATAGKTTRRISLQDPTGFHEPHFPKLELPSRVQAKATDIVDACKHAALLTDHVTLSAHEDRFVIQAQGDTDTTTTTIDDEGTIDQHTGPPTKSLFSIDYLQNMMKSAKTSVVTLRLGTDYPVDFRWQHQGIHYKAVLAPRIESN